jgi:hypothetical protein
VSAQIGLCRILLWSGLVVSLHLADGDLHIRRYLYWHLPAIADQGTVS